MHEHGHLLSLQLMRKFVVRLQVWLAKHEDDGSLVQTPQGTEGLVGINCLTKIQVFLHQSLHLENHLNSVLRYSGGRVQEVGSKIGTFRSFFAQGPAFFLAAVFTACFAQGRALFLSQMFTLL